MRSKRARRSGLMDYLGGTPLGGRTREEIVDRLMEQAAEAAAVRLDKSAVALIERVLSVSGPALKSVTAIRALLKKHRIALDEPLERMQSRIAALAKLGLADKRVSFAARFGRNMEYYTGFVFELWSRDCRRGRSDRRRRTLRHAAEDARRRQRCIPAVGCAIRSERVLAARRATGAL